MTIGTAMIALNQFAQIATQKEPITVSKMVIVSSMVNGKYSSIFPRSKKFHIANKKVLWSETNRQYSLSGHLVTDQDKPCANRLRSLPGGFILKNRIGDFRRPASAIS